MLRAIGLAPALAGWAGPAGAVTLAVCRTLDPGGASSSALVVPAGSLFRDAGRTDDPLAAFTVDRWQLRLETVAPTTIPPLHACVTAQARVTGDSAVKSVRRADNRSLIYAGSSDLLAPGPASEDLLSLTAFVLD